MKLKSQEMRELAPELDPLRIGTGWKPEDLSLSLIHIFRVQFASRGLPLFGDRKYGTGAAAAAGPLALCAMSLSFVHPSTGKPMTFSVPPSGGAFSKFKFFQDA